MAVEFAPERVFARVLDPGNGDEGFGWVDACVGVLTGRVSRAMGERRRRGVEGLTRWQMLQLSSFTSHSSRGLLRRETRTLPQWQLPV